MSRTIEPLFIRQWVMATTVGGAIAGALILTPIGINVFFLWPVFIGIGQWSVLRRVITKAWKWLLATIIGGQVATGLFAIPLPSLITYATPSKLGGEELPSPLIITLLALTLTVVTSLSFSSIQYLALQKYPRSKQWVKKGTAAVAAGLGTLISVGLVGNGLGDSYWGCMVMGGMGGAVYGLLQGHALALIINRK